MDRLSSHWMDPIYMDSLSVAESGGEKEAWGAPAQCGDQGLCHHGLDSNPSSALL